MNLRQRSSELEKMDIPGYSFDELKGCLFDIDRINRLTFAHNQTLKFVERIYKKHVQKTSRPMKLLDVGFGSGDLLFQIEEMACKKGYSVELFGIELSSWACDIAKGKKPSTDIQFFQGDFRKYDGEVDVIVSSLFTHHLDSRDLMAFVDFINKKANLAWYIHDVHRHPIPYHFIHHWTRLMDVHPMVQYDAPLSVARGFTKAEMKEVLVDSMHEFDVRVEWKIPFKLCASGVKKVAL